MTFPVPQPDAVQTAEIEQHQYLSFLLQDEAYGVGILHVREIIEYGQVTPVPMMPAFLRGVINLRGAVVPVIDLNARFGREPSQIGRRTCIVIVELTQEEQTQVVGMVVDRVEAVLEIPPQALEPVPPFGAGIRTDFIAAMAKIEERFLILLNLAQVLTWQELASLRQISAMQADVPGLVHASKAPH